MDVLLTASSKVPAPPSASYLGSSVVATTSFYFDWLCCFFDILLIIKDLF